MTLSGYRSPADLEVSDFALIEVDDQSIIGSSVPLDNKCPPIELDYDDIPPASARGFDFISLVNCTDGASMVGMRVNAKSSAVCVLSTMASSISNSPASARAAARWHKKCPSCR